MADEKDTEASRLAPEKFIPEFNRLSVEGPNNDDDDDDDDGPKKTLKPKRKHGKTNRKIRLRKTSSEVSNKKELRKASSEESKNKEEEKEEKKDGKKEEKKEEFIRLSGYYDGSSQPYETCGFLSGYYDGSSYTGQHESYKEFGRDTNRLDAFPVRPLEVSYDSKYGESDCYGGGHSGQQQSAPSVNLVANDLRSSDNNRTQEQIYLKDRGLEQGGGGQFSRRLEVDNNGSWLGIQSQLLQLARQQAHIINMLQVFKSESRDHMVTLGNRMWGLETVVGDMDHNLSLSMNNLKTSCYMNAFEESSGRSLSKYNGFSDYKSRGSSWNYQTHTRNTQIGLRKGGGPIRFGEGLSARSVWKASINEATLEAIRGAAPEVLGTENPVKNRDPGLAGWKTAMDGGRAGDMDMAFGDVLSSKDNLLLVKLMDKTGPVIDRLSGEVASEVLHAVAQFLLEPNLFDICLSWIQQLLDMSVANGTDVVRIPTEVKTEILVNLNEASSTIDPPENWEGLNLQHLHK